MGSVGLFKEMRKDPGYSLCFSLQKPHVILRASCQPLSNIVWSGYSSYNMYVQYIQDVHVDSISE